MPARLDDAEEFSGGSVSVDAVDEEAPADVCASAGSLAISVAASSMVVGRLLRRVFGSAESDGLSLLTMRASRQFWRLGRQDLS
jgi:hypothetical protein